MTDIWGEIKGKKGGRKKKRGRVRERETTIGEKGHKLESKRGVREEEKQIEGGGRKGQEIENKEA